MTNSELASPLIQAILLLTLVTLPLKIISLWRAARNDQKWWFGAILVINTIGVLELTYLFYFSKPKKQKKIQD
jgi:hypothetical protein